MDLKSITKLIKSNSWDIIDSWQKSVLNDAQIETSHSLSSYDLIDGMPVVLLAVAQSIAKPIEQELSKQGIFGGRIRSQAKVRLNQGYSLTEIFREYVWLREKLLESLKTNDVISDEQFTLYTRINRTIDEQLLATVQSYSEHYTEHLRKLATTDYLTGLNSRGAFFKQLDSELTRAKRYSHPLSLMILDLDKFKAFNDRFGHLAGDEFLKTFSKFLLRQGRENDFSARLGGDEFTVILPETNINQAIEVAQRFRRNFLKSKKLQQTISNIGVSIGIAINDNMNATELYETADMLLLKAKKAGQNKIFSTGQNKAA